MGDANMKHSGKKYQPKESSTSVKNSKRGIKISYSIQVLLQFKF